MHRTATTAVTAARRVECVLIAGKEVVGNDLGSVALERGDYVAARARYTESLALSRSLGDRTGTARAAGNLGAVLYLTGEFALARLAGCGAQLREAQLLLLLRPLRLFGLPRLCRRLPDSRRERPPLRRRPGCPEYKVAGN